MNSAPQDKIHEEPATEAAATVAIATAASGVVIDEENKASKENVGSGSFVEQAANEAATDAVLEASQNVEHEDKHLVHPATSTDNSASVTPPGFVALTSHVSVFGRFQSSTVIPCRVWEIYQVRV